MDSYQVGDVVQIMRPPSGLNWGDVHAHREWAVGEVVQVGDYANLVDVDGVRYWYHSGALRPVGTAVEEVPAAPASTPPANPKQAYGDKKVPLHLMPPSAAIYAVVGLREGVEKYGAWNFRGAPVEVMTYFGAIQRHLAAWLDGEETDTDCKYPKPHLAGAIASLCILIDAIEQGTAIDNRPPAAEVASRLLKEYALS